MRRGRIGRPGLVGTMARTAVISGTATAVSGNVARRQQARARASAPQPVPQAAAQPAPQATPAPASPPADDLVAKLQQLGQLREQGILDDDEFAVAKAKLLSS